MGGKSALLIFQVYTFYALQAILTQKESNRDGFEDEYHPISKDNGKYGGGENILSTFIIFLLVYWGANMAGIMKAVPHQHLGTALNIFLIASVATIATGLGKHTINHSIILNLLGFIAASIIHYMTSSDLSMNGISPILGYLRRRAGEDPSHQLCHAVLLIFSVSGGATIYSLGFRLSVVVWHGLVLVILGWMAFTASTTSGQADYDSGSFNEPPVHEEDLNSIPSVLMTREDHGMAMLPPVLPPHSTH